MLSLVLDAVAGSTVAFAILFLVTDLVGRAEVHIFSVMTIVGTEDEVAVCGSVIGTIFRVDEKLVVVTPLASVELVVVSRMGIIVVIVFGVLLARVEVEGVVVFDVVVKSMVS